ncbi:MAG TPA: hypothetical protein VHR66_21750 [Gemmataceae bacterium]|jgi:hypothetical protein|nr:hypothetical protein [Gemmataceae bacterium]
MNLESARELKQLLADTVLSPITGAPLKTVRSFALAAGPMPESASNIRSLALGIVRRSANNFRLAVRAQRRELVDGKEVELIRKKAKDEVDVRYIGRVTKRAAVPWTQQRHRPLQLGISVGHKDITAGTIGCFVRKPGTVGAFVLSNNHVLGNENKGKVGDAVLQAGKYDGGKEPADAIGTFAGRVKFKKSGVNLVDVAIAHLKSGIEYDPRTIRGLGKLAGLGPEFVDEGTEVAKLGRTTGLTRGKVTAFELDNVVVGFDLGDLRFDNQIEIEGAGDDPFSAGGDSGSLIVDAGTRQAIALLFAGSELGGSNDRGLTYANPIHTVLAQMKVELLLE